MTLPRSMPRSVGPATKYGLVGGVVVIPLAVAYYWVARPETVPGSVILIGGLLAGGLASRGDSRPERAGAVAGLVGSIPGILLFLPAVRDTVEAWIAMDSVVLPVLGTAFLLAFVFVFPLLTGYVSGAIGGWLANVTGLATEKEAA